VAEAINIAKYSELLTTHQFLPVAIETGGVLGKWAETLLKALGRRLIDFSVNNRSCHFLKQWIDIAVQRGNALSILSTFPIACAYWEMSSWYCCSTSPKLGGITGFTQ